MKFITIKGAVLLGFLAFFSQPLAAENNVETLSKITALVDAYGKKTVLSQVIGNSNDNFTIRLNNQLMKSPNPLRGINEAYIDAGTIRHDMKRYRVTVEELEDRLIRHDREKAALAEKQAQERLEKQKKARERQLLMQKRLQEEAELESAFEQVIGRPIEEQAESPKAGE